MTDQFPEVVWVSESTVSKVSQGATAKPPRRRQKGKQGALSSEVTTTRVRRDVWERAVHLAAHPRNIQVINDAEVIVWNHPAPWPRKEGA